MGMQGKIILAVGAHPDDLEFFAGGTISKYIKDGAKVYYLIVTDGSKGSEDHMLAIDELIKIRQDEQQNAADILGISEVIFFTYIDGELENTLFLRKEIVEVVRKVKPDVVITFDPSYLYDAEWGMVNHPDHRAVGQATLDAVFPFSRNRRTFPELFANGHDIHEVSQLLLINLKDYNHTEIITKEIETKVLALAAHISQKDHSLKVIEFMKRLSSQNSSSDYEEFFVKIDITN